jgi:hypothetical protein
VENQERQTSDAAYWQINGEEGVPHEIMMVRSMLQDLPKVTCPVGFDMRLQRRLAGDLDMPKARNTQRNWALGWTGVGLGLATALVIAVVAFDINFSGAPAGAVISGGAALPAPNVVNTTVAQPMATPSQDLATPVSEKMNAQQLAQDQTKKPVIGKDSTAPTPTTLPDGIMHMVGGNEK